MRPGFVPSAVKERDVLTLTYEGSDRTRNGPDLSGGGTTDANTRAGVSQPDVCAGTSVCPRGEELPRGSLPRCCLPAQRPSGRAVFSASLALGALKNQSGCVSEARQEGQASNVSSSRFSKLRVSPARQRAPATPSCPGNCGPASAVPAAALCLQSCTSLFHRRARVRVFAH